MIREAYRISVGHWHIQPSEFWRMSLAEWWWLMDGKQAELNRGLTEDDAEDLYTMVWGDK